MAQGITGRVGSQARRWVAIALSTLCTNLFMVVGSVVLGTLTILSSWIRPGGGALYTFVRAWGKGILAASGVRVESFLEDALEPTRCYIFMANHQSMFDIPVLLSTLPVPAGFLAKRGLFRIPVFGWALTAAGFIPVDRGDRTRAAEAFSSASRQLDRGTSVLLFPEETRSLDGTLLPFRRGGFLLAIKSGWPIVPVGLSGTLQVQRKGSVVVRPGPVTVRYGRPIEVAHYGLRDKQELISTVQRRVAELAGTTGKEPGAIL